MGSAVRAGDLVLDDFRPSHVVPRHGMPAWDTPGTARPTVPLDPFLPVQLLERMGDWARVLCSNGWSAWVDGRLLVSVPEDPPAAAHDMARAADPRPLLARAEASLGRYRGAAEDLAAGRVDGEGFRRGTAGLRLGVVVEGEAMWLYDAEHERWLYCDGTRLAEYATSSTPSATPPPPPPEPPAQGATRMAPPGDAGDGDAAAGAQGGAAGHEPTRVVPVRADEPPPAGPAAPPVGPPHGRSPAGYEPTRVVQAPGPGPAQGARAPDAPPDAPPDASPGGPDSGPVPPRADAGHEPTRLARAPDAEPARPARPPGAEPTRVVRPGAGGPARAEPGGAAPVPDDDDGAGSRGADGPDDSHPSGRPSAAEPTRVADLPAAGRARRGGDGAGDG
ncbi:SH3 domain-containing protein [Streptomyces thermolilacinus]|uniref:Uncharacterized protein n=1 Tax=Streptomyces thermolilacinus SPC6 TaxID=1306406 RepID=A0A1D3DZ07_9ACTN|nr:hypothetical protein [Streptomyces thermolilacinus]OEJ97563.1 hypothetical protein J116_027015 [Streptomyces thermolilacinus SPC6]